MKHKLTRDDAEAAVWGGAILGGGGGGHIETALRTAERVFGLGQPELWSADELPDDAVTATVSLVGTPSGAGTGVAPDDVVRSLELLRDGMAGKRALAAVNSNENGAETTMNGWLHSAMTGLPVLDLACNGRAHPTSLMGSMGLHLESAYRSMQGFAGGKENTHVEGFIEGDLEIASDIVRRASARVGGFLAVSRNPVRVDYARRHGAPRAISQAMALGRDYLDGGMKAAVEHMHGRIATEGTVTDYQCRQEGGLDVGHFDLDDREKTRVHFVNEYIFMEASGHAIARFPDLIMTFSNGRPVISAHVRAGSRLSVVVAGEASLSLSVTMGMPGLYQPLNSLLGRDIFPLSAENPREGSMD